MAEIRQPTIEEDLQEIKATESILQGLQRGIDVGLPIAGGVAGGLVGAASPVPGGTLMGGGLGAALGGQLANITRPYLTGEPRKPLPQEMLQAGKQVGVDLALGAGGGVAAKGLFAAEQKLLAPFAKKVIPEAVEAAKTLAPFGGRLTPAQQSSSWIVDLGENIAEGSLIGGGVVRKTKETVPPALRAMAGAHVTGLGSIPKGAKEVSQLVLDAVQSGREAATAVQKTLYADVDNLARGTRVDTSTAVNFITKGLKSKRKDVELALSVVPEWQQWLTRKLPASPVLGPTGSPARSAKTVLEGSFRDVQAAKSRLAAMSRKSYADPQSESGARTAGFIAHLLKNDLNTAAGNLSPQARLAWDTAETFTAREGARLNNEIVRAGLRQLRKTGQVHKLLLQADNGTRIGKFKDALGPAQWAPVEADAARSIILGSLDPATKTLDGGKLSRRLASLGEETLDALFSASHRADLNKLTETALTATRPGGTTGTAKVVVALAQGGAIFRFFSDPVSAAIIVGPWALGKGMTTQSGTKFLTTGIQAGTKARVAAHVGGQVATGYPREAIRPYLEE